MSATVIDGCGLAWDFQPNPTSFPPIMMINKLVFAKIFLNSYLVLATGLLTPGAWAQDSSNVSPYSFGGACSSQGAWTQAALTAAQNLKKITAQLKDDPGCKALGVSVTAAIENIQNSIKAASESSQDVAKLSHLPTEISALRSYVGMNPNQRTGVLKLMMDKAIQGASIASKVTTQENTTNSLMDFGTRLRTSTNTGIGMLNQVLENIPQLNECMIGENASAMGSFIAMSTQVAASFANSGQDGMASKLALTVSKITNLQRDAKFSKVLRKLNQQEFLSSMACLMEVTSESYCQARDEMGLFKQVMSSLNVNRDRLKEITKTNPFAGFYILNTHVPNVTRWLQKVQIGVHPRLSNDATFQNNIQPEITSYKKSNESVSDIQYTVEDSLNAIEAYLHLLQNRLGATGGDPSLIPTILDTQYRIQTILDKFEGVRKVGLQLKQMNPREITHAGQLAKPLEAYEDLINTVYEQFNVQHASSGYLADRMSNFVNEDYILLVRNKVNFTEAQQDLFYAVGMSSFEKMLQINNGNPANVQTDLNMALKINEGNIEVLESLLKDNVVNAIAKAKLVSEGKTDATWDSFKRILKNSIAKNKGLPLYGLGYGFGESMISEIFQHGDRYTYSASDDIRSPESEFGDSHGVYAQLCIQALAFPNQQGVQDLCAGAVLESPMKQLGRAGMSYDQRLNSYLDPSTLSSSQKNLSMNQRKSYNHSERICALRDYNRQNMVLFMTLGKGNVAKP